MARLFVYDQREFPDPDPKLPVDEVRKQLAEFFPELANAEAREERRGEDTVVTFTKRIGTKGLRHRGRPRYVAAVLRRVAATRLRIFELAQELLGADGELDVDRAAQRQPEINLAVAGARAYARENQQAAEALRQLPAR